MSKEKKPNAAEVGAATITAIEGRYQASRNQPEKNSPITMLDDIGDLLKIVKDLDDENMTLATEIVMAQSYVAQAKSMVSKKNSAKQMVEFRKLVATEAKEYAKDHVEGTTHTLLKQVESHLERMKTRALIWIGSLLLAVLSLGTLLGLIWFKVIKLPV